MKNGKDRHLKIEQEAWLRTLDHLQEENVFLKTNLAYVIMNDIDNSILEQAEHYQSLFVIKDALIALLRHDIAGQCRPPGQERHVQEDAVTIKKQDRLRLDMDKMERSYSKMKIKFNKFVAKNL